MPPVRAVAVRNFVFDVDGTLTPSREKIDPYFEQFFIEFCRRNKVYIVTGSDSPKTKEQLGVDILDSTQGMFFCSGNIFYQAELDMQTYNFRRIHRLKYRNEFDLDPVEETFLNEELKRSGFSVRTGNHIERRPGAVNFSIVGRNASKEERASYILWDINTNERQQIAERITTAFPRLECVLGGETGMDIYLKGMNKGQVRQHLEGEIIFFGDKGEPGGNDYPLAILADKYYNVKNWEETEYILRMEYGKV